jgi:transcriptional regulator with XRE-family HTH domain
MMSNPLGRFIRQRRREIGLTQPQLAQKLHLRAAVSVCRWERGNQSVPPKLLRALAEILEVPLHTILSYTPKEAVEAYRQLERQLAVVPSTKATRAAPPLFDDPELQEGYEALQRQYPAYTALDFMRVALKRYLAQARSGLDANLDPIGQPLPPAATSNGNNNDHPHTDGPGREQEPRRRKKA